MPKRSLDADTTVSCEAPAIIVPEVPHSMEPIGTVRFDVEFWRTPDT